MNLYSRFQDLVQRLMFFRTNQSKIRVWFLVVVALILGFGVSAALEANKGRKSWPEMVSFGVVYALVLLSVLLDSSRIRSVGPTKRFSADKNISVAIILINSSAILLANIFGSWKFLLYVILLIDVALLVLKFGWKDFRKKSSASLTIPNARTTSKH